MMQDKTPNISTVRSEGVRDMAKSALATGGLLAAFGVASCCALPVLLGVLGLGSASLFGMFGIALLVGPYQRYVLVGAVICLLGAGWTIRRQRQARACIAGAACERPLLDWLSKIAVALAVGLLALTFWIEPPI